MCCLSFVAPEKEECPPLPTSAPEETVTNGNDNDNGDVNETTDGGNSTGIRVEWGSHGVYSFYGILIGMFLVIYGVDCIWITNVGLIFCDIVNDIKSSSTVCVGYPNFHATVLADGLAPNGARPSADTMLTVKFWNDILEVLWLLRFPIGIGCSDDIIQNCRRDSTIYRRLLLLLTHGRCGNNFESVVFKLVLKIDILSTSQ